jgi:hypothetical protein
MSEAEMVERGLVLNSKGRWSQSRDGLSERLGLTPEVSDIDPRPVGLDSRHGEPQKLVGASSGGGRR